MKVGDEIKVRNDESDGWEERKFVFKKDSFFYCVDCRHTTRFEHNGICLVEPWKYAEEIPEPEYVPY